MNVVYASDDNYVMLVGISMISLFENQRKSDIVDVFLLANNISKSNLEILENILRRYGQNMTVIPVERILKGLSVTDKFPLSAYSRLFIANHIDSDKVLYLDCDTVVNGNLKSLYNTDIEDFYVAGVQDNAALLFRRSIGLSEEERYINSGVLLMNLKKMRKENFDKKVADVIQKYNGEVPHFDQGIINYICKGKIKYLSPEYNLMPPMLWLNSRRISALYNIPAYYSQKDIDNAKKNPVIIHFTEMYYGRPWHEVRGGGHPLADKFDFYKDISPWQGMPKTEHPYPMKWVIRDYMVKYMPLPILKIYAGIRKRT